MRDNQLAAVLGPVLSAAGFDLEAVEILPAGKRRILRVVVDGDGPDGRGPTLDDVADATRVILRALDDSPAVGSAPYTLEVSTRGVSRPLEQPRHWRRNRGRLVAVRLTDGTERSGRIGSSDEEAVELEVDGSTQRLPYAEVRSAQVQVEFNRPVADLDEDEEG